MEYRKYCLNLRFFFFLLLFFTFVFKAFVFKASTFLFVLLLLFAHFCDGGQTLEQIAPRGIQNLTGHRQSALTLIESEGDWTRTYWSCLQSCYSVCENEIFIYRIIES